MRIFVFILAAFLYLTSCSKNQEPFPSIRTECIEVEFDEPVQIRVNERVCTPDRKEFRLEESINQLCDCGVWCVLPGFVELQFAADIQSTSQVLKTYSSTLSRDSLVGYTIEFSEFKTDIDCPPDDMGNTTFTIAIQRY